MKAKKHLGQNFLKSKKIVERMVKGAGISSEDCVIEIGPGKGILTEALLKSGAKVIAVEKDTGLLELLQKKFETALESGQLKILNADILDIEPKDLEVGKYKIVANIPYYITGEILRKFLSESLKPLSMTLLVQKEVAKRIVASNKKESLLSLSVKIFGEPKILEIVKKTMFSPAPKVDSAVIHIANISNSSLERANISETDLFSILKLAFSQKRKQLLGNLKREKNVHKLIDLLESKEIPLTVRAEDLPLELWLEIVKIFK